jgi:hypothetical protein
MGLQMAGNRHFFKLPQRWPAAVADRATVPNWGDFPQRIC